MCFLFWRKSKHNETKDIMKNESLKIDKHKIERCKGLFPVVMRKSIEFIEVINKQINCGVFEGIRTFEKQDEYYASGRDNKRAIKTNQKGGYSYHNYGLAIDIVFLDEYGNWKWPDKEDSRWKIIGKIGQEIGFEWGYDIWNWDCPHFQMTFGFEAIELLALYEKGGLDLVWQIISQKLK